MKIIILSLLALTMSCSTPYQSSGLRGGYKDQKLASDMYRVSFLGNAYTSHDDVEQHLLKRCAELTLENNFTHFAMVSGGSKEDTNFAMNRQGQITHINSITRHSTSVIVKMFNNPAPEQVAFEAETIFGPYTKKSASLPRSEEIDKLKE